MARPEDAALLDALEAQLRELNYLQARVDAMRSTLLPAPASFWRGAAGRVYEAERSALAEGIARGSGALSTATSLTSDAVERVIARV